MLITFLPKGFSKMLGLLQHKSIILYSDGSSSSANFTNTVHGNLGGSTLINNEFHGAYITSHTFLSDLK